MRTSSDHRFQAFGYFNQFLTDWVGGGHGSFTAGWKRLVTSAHFAPLWDALTPTSRLDWIAERAQDATYELEHRERVRQDQERTMRVQAEAMAALI